MAIIINNNIFYNNYVIIEFVIEIIILILFFKFKALIYISLIYHDVLYDWMFMMLTKLE